MKNILISLGFGLSATAYVILLMFLLAKDMGLLAIFMVLFPFFSCAFYIFYDFDEIEISYSDEQSEIGTDIETKKD